MGVQLHKAFGVGAAFAVAGGLVACGASSSSTQPTTPKAAASVPLTMVTERFPPGTPPAVRAIVRVRIGGGPPVPLLLDTGSAGLRVLPRALGSGVTLTHQVVSDVFPAGEVLGNRAVASVAIGSVTTRAPIGMQVIRRVVCAPGLRRISHCENFVLRGIFASTGAVGIMGVDTRNAFGSNVYSPLVQLTPPYSQGFSLRLVPQGSGTLLLGQPQVVPGTVTAPLMRSSPPSYRTGAPAYKRDVRMCWTVGRATSCGLTDFDIGTPTPTLATGGLRGGPVEVQSGGRVITPGTQVTVKTPSGKVVWHYTANSQYGNGLTQIVPLSGTAAGGYITGIPAFYSHTIGWNMATGQIVTSPK